MTIRDLIEKLKPHEDNINDIQFHLIRKDGIGYIVGEFNEIVKTKGAHLNIELQEKRHG